jgi:metabolite-proton symporter
MNDQPPRSTAISETSASTPAASSRRKNVQLVVLAASGNFLEMYDFMVFGFYATWIAKTFFPTTSEFASLMLTLATFGAGFLMRPVGALVLGAYIDKHGRKRGLMVTLGLMALGTLSITCMPGFATAGILAPLVVLIGRLLQGLSAGAEVGGVSVYLAEIATPGRRGFYVSWQSASQQVAVVFASLLGLIVSQNLTSAQMAVWGWRIPFAIGCLMIPFIFLIRRSLEETPAFLARKHQPPTLGQVAASMARNWRLVLTGTLLVMMTTVSFYMITAYTPTYGNAVLKLSARDSLFVSCCVGLSNFVLLPVMGSLSDRIGRRPLLNGCTVIALLTAYPALSWLAAAPSFGRLLGVELWLSLIYAGYNGAMIVYLTEVMPADVRTAGFSLAYSLATAIFGGFTPMIATWLIRETGNKAIPGAWLATAALCSLIATVLLGRRERRLPEAAPS